MAALLIVIAVAGVLVGLGLGTRQQRHTDLEAVVLDEEDVPLGFQHDPERSGLSSESLPLPAWVPARMQEVAAVPTHTQVWRDLHGRELVVVGFRLPLEILAGFVFDAAVESLIDQASREFDIPAVRDARGLVIDEPDRAPPTVEHWATFRRGNLVFVLKLERDASRAGDLDAVRGLVERQADLLPPGQSRPAQVGEARLAAGFAAAALAALLGYVALMSFAAWLIDPLRGRANGGAERVEPAAPRAAATVFDVRTQARRKRRAAQRRLVVQFVGIAVASPGLLPFTWPLGLGLLAVGVAIAALPRVMIAPSGASGRAGSAALFTGRRLLRVGAYSTIAAACVLGGLAGMVLVGIGAVITSPAFGYNVLTFAASSVLIGVGTLLHRRARRLAAFDARELLRRDKRAMVLFLRAFADDRLALRAATAAHRSLLERLSPRRFDRFEEVLARTVGDVGPVVAVNPPGTTLAPLGAARETLQSDQWQNTVAEWMREARLVVLAAPHAPTSGLSWELRTIDAQRLWHKTLIILPPLTDDAVRDRWRQLAPLVEGTAMAGHQLPADPAHTLVLAGTSDRGWIAVTGARRDEWTYTAALGVAFEGRAETGDGGFAVTPTVNDDRKSLQRRALPDVDLRPDDAGREV